MTCAAVQAALLKHCWPAALHLLISFWKKLAGQVGG